MSSTVPPFRFLSVCSGIEAASVAWLPLGWECAGVSEIEPFPCAVLAHHYPDVKNFGDFTKIEASDIGAVDLLVGGTPCQDFSVAGLRAGLTGDRGRLTIEYCKLAERLRPRWLVWENVPGVLSADDGNAFGVFLGALAELGYGTAYRVLDAQYFGVPQRRRRVFVVGHSGQWQRAAAVLFERESLSWHPAPSRAAGQNIARTLRGRANASHREDTDTYVSGTIGAEHGRNRGLGNENETDMVVAFGWNKSAAQTLRVDEYNTTALQASSTSNPAIAFQCQGTNVGEMGTLRGGNGNETGGVPFIATSGVRRLTPRECERLQGFPNDYTLVQYRGKCSPDGPRYKALGNSMAVPVMRWIGERIQMVDLLEAA